MAEKVGHRNVKPRTVVLVTGHYWDSKRRAGFHWLADAYWRAGWRVVFMTTGISWALWIRRRDHRLAYPILRERNRIRWFAKDFASYVWLTPWHPSRLSIPLLDRASGGLLGIYPRFPLGEVKSLIASADLVIFESTPGILLYDRIRSLAPSARVVYRVSDDLRLLHSHPVVLQTENRIAPLFDLVSVPSGVLLDRFRRNGNAELHYHGVRKDLFDRDFDSPFDVPAAFNALFVGISHIDRDFVDRASSLFPKARFHIVGPFDNLPSASNIVSYGEIPFEETLPFMRHADIGMNTRRWAPGAESLTDSLKVLQYTYCRLPIIAPDFLRSGRSHTTYYRPGDDESIRSRIERALEIERPLIDRSDIRSWDELARCLAGAVGAVASSAKGERVSHAS